jgi:hypothetical protein
MHSRGWWKRPAGQAAPKWCRRLLMYGVLLGLFALAASVATSERSHRDEATGRQTEPAAIAGTDGQSNGGNLVPLY